MTAVEERPAQVFEGAEATPEFEALAERQERRRGVFYALPAYLYLIVFFAIPFLIVVVYSFATRTRTGGVELGGWNLDSYQRLWDEVVEGGIVRDVLVRSLGLALLTTVICLVIAYPFSYYITTRSPAVRNVMLALVMIPFWTNFLVRNYAWRLILANEGPLSNTTDTIGLGPTDILFTNAAVVLGMVYAFLPFMVLPLYASIERIDKSLIEASRDLYGNSSQTFWRVIFPLSLPGVIAGCILVFVPAAGAYVTPAILGGNKNVLLGSYIVDQFGNARNFPFGASLSVVLMVLMLTATLAYFRSGGRNL